MARKLVTPDDYIFEFNRRTGEAAYQRMHKQTSQQAIQALVKEGMSPSTAKKRVNKVVRHLADVENAMEQQRQLAMGEATTAMQR